MQKNLDLFEESVATDRHRNTTVTIASARDQSQLSKAQKAFNTLIKQIEKRRDQLAAWEAAIPAFQRKYASDLVPLVETSTDLQVKLVYCLDRASEQKGLTKTERRKLASLITHLAGELVAARGDAELKAVYNKHSRSDYDREEAAAMKGMKSMLEDVLGVELGDDPDLSSPEGILQRAQAHMHDKQQEYEAERQAREKRQAKRKKSTKQLAKEAQLQAEEQQMSKSIREVYRKLASALHPDREPDPQERERKNVLMQRANQAYDKNNLLQLLELQLELEHIDQTAIDSMSEDRLTHYNKILKEQLVELEQEIHDVEGRFRAQFDISPFDSVSPKTMMINLASEIVGVKHAIRDLKRDLLELGDGTKLKMWLKSL